MNPTATPTPQPRRGIAFQVAAVLMTIVCAGAATGLARWLRPTSPDTPKAGAVKFPERLFADWKKPDVVLVLTGQQHGYLQPCGCSSPQVGGLERRYNLMQMLKSAGWPIAAIDLGDLAQRTGPAGLPNQQGMIKYLYSMKALKTLGYSAVGFGDHEVNLGLGEVLANYALNDDRPRVLTANLMDAEKNYPGMTAPWQPIDVKEADLRLGVVSITGSATALRIKDLARNDATLRFAEPKLTLPNVNKQLAAAQVDLPILLFQGSASQNGLRKPTGEGVALAEAHPEFPLILCHSIEDDPPLRPIEVKTKNGTTTQVITVGHKGKFVGVVGVWKTGKKDAPFTFRYERVELTEDYLTPKDKEKDHPIIALMEQYTKELKDKEYLERYGQVRHAIQVMGEVKDLRNPGEATYLGSEACKKCHEHAYDIWKKTGHSHAYQTLADAKKPDNRQFDPECIVCHVVGFGYQGGFVTEKKSPKLKDVGCESCHGPSSVHAANPKNEEWHRRINPWKYLAKEKRKDAIDQMCQKCHDQDNDVTWLNNGFERKWPKVEHNTPE